MSDSNVEHLFFQALETTSPEEREAFLQRQCRGDAALKSRIERLLLANESAEGVFPSEPRQATILPEISERLGTLIGRYKLLEQIGEGGFGVVYMAEQEEPVRRKVALKIIKLGMDTRQVIARFEAERQALAMMDHPNIAKVLDAGATETGRPYFVMELVRGIPITQFCEENRLTINERLQLFIPVCQAIQHAHQKGVIHRDVKPSNVLVTMNEGVPHAMVIDFGVAKAIDQRLTEKTLYTRFAQMIGTPAYMSPEQAEMSKQDVDTRTDVYSLGVLLYELLTGTTPFPEDRLREAGYAEIQRIISQEEPVRPSTVLSRLNGRSRNVAASRRCEPASLMKLIKGDLDWIVLKAIEKDRNRRYATASDLATDLQRHLSNEPVTARPVSQVYLLRKFVRRHPTPVWSGAAILAAIVIGLGLSWAGLRQAQRREETAQATLAVIQDLLRLPDPYKTDDDLAANRDLKLLTAIELMSERLPTRIGDQPLVEAGVRLTMGRTFLGLGELSRARGELRQSLALYEEALGKRDEHTLAARHAWGELLRAERRGEEALSVLNEVHDLRRQILGESHADTLDTLSEIGAVYQGEISDYPRAEEIYREVIQKGTAALGEGHPVVTRAMARLSDLYWEQGSFADYHDYADAVLSLQRASLGTDHPDVLRAELMQALELRYLHYDWWGAEELGEDVLARCRRALGSDHRITLDAFSEQPFRTAAKGLVGIALQQRHEALELSLNRYGPRDSMTLFLEDMLGGTLQVMGDYPAAEDVHRSTMLTRLALGPTESVSEQRSMRWLAWAVYRQGRVEEADELYARVVKDSIHAHGEVNARTLYNVRVKSHLLGRQAKWEDLLSLHLQYAAGNTHVSEARPLGQFPTSYGIAAAAVLEREDSVRDLVGLLLERLGNSTNRLAQTEIATTCLSLRREWLTERQWERVRVLAEQALDPPATPLTRNLLGGMLAYRAGQFDRCREFLTPLIDNPDNQVAAMAGYLRAMASIERGRIQEAAHDLSRADARLDVGLSPGLLGHEDKTKSPRWVEYARTLHLRGQAKALISPEQASPLLTSQHLASVRQAWQPVQSLFNDMEEMGKRRDWAAAHAALVRILEHGPINWEYQGNLILNHYAKAAIVLALAGDFERYRELLAERLEQADLSQSYYNHALLMTNGLSAETVEKAIRMARWEADSQTGPWVSFRSGVAEYRAGRFQESLEGLEAARGAFNLNCSGSAYAVSALAAHAAGRSSEAQRHLDRAKTTFETIQNGNPDCLGREWQETAAFELLLRETEAHLHPAYGDGRPRQSSRVSGQTSSRTR